MRVMSGDSNAEFAKFLSSMSYSPEMRGAIKVPPFIRRLHSVDSLLDQIFPAGLLNGAQLNHEAFKGRAILSFRNDTVSAFNIGLISKLPAEMHVFNAVNSVPQNDATPGVEALPAEFLQSLELASLPPSKLCLKIGAPVILL